MLKTNESNTDIDIMLLEYRNTQVTLQSSAIVAI